MHPYFAPAMNQPHTSNTVYPLHLPTTILLIEDTETDCLTYTRYLQSAPDTDYRITCVNKLMHGIASWRSHPPDVVLLDMHLPDGDGIEFLEFLQENCPEATTKLPVVVLTGQGNERVAVQAMKLGAMDYLVKSDITANTLQKSVSAVVEYQALSRQLLQSRQQKELLSEIALRIRQSLNLPQILQSAVDGLRQLLDCDRAIIFQFHPDWSGRVAVESVCTEELSLLNQAVLDPCFASQWHEPYRQGRISYVYDRERDALQPCYAELLASLQVRANLVTPILQNEQLWGLLIAHECYHPRHWETSDIDWVMQLATQVSIAIQQATTYANLQIELRERQYAEVALQQLNQELEDRVAQRTTALRQSEARLQEAQQIARLGHWEFDLPTARIIWSPEVFRIFGRDPHQSGPTFEESLQPFAQSDRECIEAFIQQAIQTGEGYEFDIPFVRTDGSSGYLFVKGSPIQDQQGDVVRLVGIVMDISDRKQTEAQLQSLRERLEFILSSSPAVLYTCRPYGNYAPTFVSENIASHLGYTPDDLTTQADLWLNSIHPDDRPKIMTDIPQVFAQGHQSLAYRFQHKNGDYRWIQDEIKLVASVDGNPRELVGYLVDISDRHEIQTQLQHLSDRLTLALESAEMGTWDWDLSHEAIWDEQMYKLYGLEHLQRPATYQDWLNAIHPDDRVSAEQNFEQGLLQGKLDREFRIVLPDGTIRYLRAVGLMHYDPMGQPQRMVGINYDITARKLTEAHLIRYTQEVEDLYDHAPCGYHSVDAEGYLIRVNATELEWLGYTREEMIGRPLMNFLTQEGRQICLTTGPILCQQGWLKDVELTMLCKDGSVLPVLINATAVRNEQGHFLHSRTTLMDIRDRKQFEQELRQTNAELARATRLKDEFLANMSHELRTPLTAILGMSDVLMEEFCGPLNERQRQYVAVIQQSGMHLLSLINDILDLAKIESGKLELQFSTVFVEALCESSLAFVKQIANKAGIQLNMRISPEVIEITVDELRIRQALINLLSNAVKFTPEGGQVTLEVKRDRVPQWIYVSVTDTGIGIAAEDISKLFQSFVQIDSGSSRQYSGTGLGLALIKKIVELHQGTVSVESVVGQGSCFTLRLPERPIVDPSPNGVTPSEIALPLDHTEPDPADQRTGQYLILLVENDPANVATLSAYLTHQGYQLLVANDGEAAIALAIKHHPDIILMNVQMPKMDGLEATRQIRRIFALAQTPIIALTALAMTGDRDRCLEAGANDYLSKPINFKLLVELIQHYSSS